MLQLLSTLWTARPIIFESVRNVEMIFAVLDVFGRVKPLVECLIFDPEHQVAGYVPWENHGKHMRLFRRYVSSLWAERAGCYVVLILERVLAWTIQYPLPGELLHRFVPGEFWPM